MNRRNIIYCFTIPPQKIFPETNNFMASLFVSIHVTKNNSDSTPKLQPEKFYVVNNIDDEKTICAEARNMLLHYGQTNYHFYGSQEPLWHLAFDYVDSELYGDTENVALTMGYDKINDFVDELMREIENSDNCGCYLYYDDYEIYNKVKELLVAKHRITEVLP